MEIKYTNWLQKIRNFTLTLHAIFGFFLCNFESLVNIPMERSTGSDEKGRKISWGRQICIKICTRKSYSLGIKHKWINKISYADLNKLITIIHDAS